MNLQELRQKHAGLCDQQQAIVNAALAEGRLMTEDEEAKFEDLQKQIDGFNALIKKAEEVQARAKVLDEPADPKTRFVPGDYSQKNKGLDNGGFKDIGELVHALRFGDNTGRVAALPVNKGEGGGVALPEAFARRIMPQFRNEWTMETGAEGGFAVPTQQLGGDPLMIRPEDAIIRPRASVIPAGDPPDGAITMPAFTQGAKGVFGGVEVYWIGEGAFTEETGANLKEVQLQPREVAAHTVVTDKLLRNWQAASAFISFLLRGATGAAEDIAFLRGNGVAKPIGILSGAGTLAVNRAAANQISYVDVTKMFAKLLPESVGRAMFIANQSALPQIATLKDDGGRYIYIGGDATRGIPATLAGIPIRFTGKTPVLGSKGDLMLVDPLYYLIKDGSGPFIAASEHVYFKHNKTVIKVVWNVDGKGWVNEPLTLDDGQTQVSAYVVLDVPAA